MSIHSQIAASVLSFIRSTYAVEQATYVIFVSILIIRVRIGYFPTYTKWSALIGLWGLLQLWLRHKRETHGRGHPASHARQTGKRVQ